MCGRFTLRRPLEDVVKNFNIRTHPDPHLFPTAPENVSPGQIIPIVREASGERELAGCLWGLIPSWSKDGKPLPNTINARSETLADKPAFRSAYKSRRCLIVRMGSVGKVEGGLFG